MILSAVWKFTVFFFFFGTSKAMFVVYSLSSKLLNFFFKEFLMLVNVLLNVSINYKI